MTIVLDKLEEIFKRSEEWRLDRKTHPHHPLHRVARLLVQKAPDRTVPPSTDRGARLAG